MQVRYQTAPRPDRGLNHTAIGVESPGEPRLPGTARAPRSAPQDLDQFLEFQSHLMDQLLALIQVHLSIIAGQAVARPADGKPLLIEQAANLSDDEHVLALIIAAIAAALDGLELRELLLPVTQHVGFDAAQVADLTDGEVALAWNGRKFAIVAWFQHMPQRALSISGQDGMSRRDGH